MGNTISIRILGSVLKTFHVNVIASILDKITRVFPALKLGTTLKHDYDLTTSTGRLMFQLLGAFAEFERNLIKERVKAGLANAKAKGVRLGRPSQKFDEDELVGLRKSGISIRGIAERLGLRKSFVHKTLSNYDSIPL